MSERPPLGLKPRFIHEEQRLDAVRDAITRYIAAGYDVPMEWTEEFCDLKARIEKRKKNV
jgi:hypothetical protein